MYAQLFIDAQRMSWESARASAGQPNETPLTGETAAAFQRSATTIVAQIFAGPHDDPQAAQDEKSRVFSAVMAIVPRLIAVDLEDPDLFDFRIRCAIAHHRLPAIERSAREARIAGIVDGMLTDATWRNRLKTEWQALKNLGVLIPDPIMDEQLRANTGTLLLSTFTKLAPGTPFPLSPIENLLRSQQARKFGPVLDDFAEIALNIYATRLPADRPAALALIQALVAQDKLVWVLNMKKLLSSLNGPWDFGASGEDFMVRVLQSTLSVNDQALRAQVLQFELQRLMNTQSARLNQVIQLSIDAVRDGVPLGERYVAAVTQALLQERQVIDDAQHVDPAALRQRRDAVPAGPTSADMDPVHTWSVSRLLEWIEGPVTRQTIDRQRIATKERERRQARAAHARDPLTMQAAEPDREQDDADVQLMVDDALQATAAFFLGDIDEMLALGTRLKLAGPLLDPCRHLREALSALSLQRETVNVDHAHDVLTRAEAAIAQLRGQIRGTQATQQQQMAFGTALLDLLGREPLVLGKRHGGVIACPMPPSAWPWVVTQYHGRWLSKQRTLDINGHVVQLRPDQALALYVTGSSQSDFAFDVSVHLWQRRPGRKGLASSDVDGLHMNTVDWYDTYIPCAVLHVPPGK